MSRAPEGPKLHVLQYMSKKAQPSWVRVISSRALWVVGSGYLIIFLVLVEGFVDRYFRWWFSWSWQDNAPFAGWSNAWNPSGWIEFCLTTLFNPLYPSYSWEGYYYMPWYLQIITAPAFWLAVMFFLGGVVVFCIAPAVRRGHRAAVWVGNKCLAPALAFTAVLAALCMAAAIVNLAGFFRFNDRAQIILFLPGLLFGFVTLLLVDLRACLRWISRTPLEEMPKRKFA